MVRYGRSTNYLYITSITVPLRDVYFACMRQINPKNLQYILPSMLQQLSHVGSKTENWAITWPFGVETGNCQSPFCPSIAHWSTRLERGWAQMAWLSDTSVNQATGCILTIWSRSFQILAHLWCQLTAGFSPLSADSGSQTSKRKCTSVTYKKCMPKKIFKNKCSFISVMV